MEPLPQGLRKGLEAPEILGVDGTPGPDLQGHPLAPVDPMPDTPGSQDKGGSQRMKINHLTVDFQPSLSPQGQGSGEWGWVTLIRKVVL